jgi:hypothetical protein
MNYTIKMIEQGVGLTEEQVKSEMLVCFKMIEAAVRVIIEDESDETQEMFFMKNPNLEKKSAFFVVMSQLVKKVAADTNIIIENLKGQENTKEIIVSPREIIDSVKRIIEKSQKQVENRDKQ